MVIASQKRVVNCKHASVHERQIRLQNGVGVASIIAYCLSNSLLNSKLPISTTSFSRPTAIRGYLVGAQKKHTFNDTLHRIAYQSSFGFNDADV